MIGKSLFEARVCEIFADDFHPGGLVVIAGGAVLGCDGVEDLAGFLCGHVACSGTGYSLFVRAILFSCY